MDQPVIRCAACGGPLAPGAMRCAFCGSQLAQAACPACLALVPIGARHCPTCGKAFEKPEASEAIGMKCPGCCGTLGSVKIGDVPLRPCPACGGIWMGRTDFEALARTHEARDVFLGSPHGKGQLEVPGLDPLEVRYRPCPACGKLMNRMNYARISGVVLDACREDGLWFDRDELRKVVLFIESGGLDRAARRELETHRPEATGLGALPANAGTAGMAGGMLTDGSLPGQVGEVLLDATRLLWRLLH